MKHGKGGMSVTKIKTVIVRRIAGAHSRHLARLEAGPMSIRASIGRNGLSRRKREGDGCTPTGCFQLKSGFYRRDRIKWASGLAGVTPMRQGQGWCDDPDSQQYNRPVPASSRLRHEKLWRMDPVYDVVITTDHNQRPRVMNTGSAIFFHLARPGFQATDGCVAILREDMRKLLPKLSKKARILILD